MVTLIIQVEDFSFGLVDFERDPPVAGDGEDPGFLAFATPPHSARLDRLGEGDVGVRQGRIEGQVNGRFTAAVPVAVSHTGREDDERAG